MAGKSMTLRNAIVDKACKDSPANYFNLFTGDPDSGGTELSGGSNARVQVTAPAASNAQCVWPTAEITVPAGASPTHWARFATASGGTPYESGALTGGGPGAFVTPGTFKLNVVWSEPA